MAAAINAYRLALVNVGARAPTDDVARLPITSIRARLNAFQNPGGQPMKTVPLTPGRNVFTVRSYGDGVCREEQGGCKYDVVNTGDPGRPVLDPHVIIWQ